MNNEVTRENWILVYETIDGNVYKQVFTSEMGIINYTHSLAPGYSLISVLKETVTRVDVTDKWR